MDASSLQRLIKKMLDSRDLMPETREELEEYRAELEKGTLHPDDASYVEGLARRLGYAEGGSGAAGGGAARDDDDEDRHPFAGGWGILDLTTYISYLGGRADILRPATSPPTRVALPMDRLQQALDLLLERDLVTRLEPDVCVHDPTLPIDHERGRVPPHTELTLDDLGIVLAVLEECVGERLVLDELLRTFGVSIGLDRDDVEPLVLVLLEQGLQAWQLHATAASRGEPESQ